MRGLYVGERPLLISRDHPACGNLSRATPRSCRAPSRARSIATPMPRPSARSKRLAQALLRLGIEPGDRVGTLAWNTYRHFELYYGDLRHRRGVPHDQPAPLRRPDRLHRQPRARPPPVCRYQLYPADRAAAAAISRRLPDRAARRGRRRRSAGARHLRRAGRRRERRFRLARVRRADAPRRFATPRAPPASPRARSTATARRCIHALGASLPRCDPDDGARCRSARWCRCSTPAAGAPPYTAPINGAKLVLPGRAARRRQPLRAVRGRGRDAEPRRADGLARLRGVSARRPDARCTTLRGVLSGGSAVPPSLIEAFEARGIDMVQGWGMTEMSPLGTVAALKAKHAGLDAPAAADQGQSRAGRSSASR